MTKSASQSRIAGLDILRGLASIAVVLGHTWHSVFPGAGLVGVIVFFTLSGYLITGLLNRELALHGQIDFRAFYARRLQRLAPALVALLAVFSVVTVLLDPIGDRDRLSRTLLFALTWTGDLPFGHASPATFHLWTLAVEEQFYLVWPVVLLFAFRAKRLRCVVAGAGLLCLLAGWLTVLWLHHAPDLAYDLPTTWACCFVIGGLVRLSPVGTGRALGWVCGAAVASLIGLAILPLRGHLLTYILGGPLIAGLTAILLVSWSASRATPGPGRRTLMWFGRVSYATYIWNYPLTLWLRPIDPTGLTSVALTLAAAELSWRYVESPLMSIRRTEVQTL